MKWFDEAKLGIFMHWGIYGVKGVMESWSFYNEFNQSFYSLSKSAKSYLNTIEKAGYKGMLYSSKKYLETVWYDLGYDIWLAHYTDETTYKGKYTYWQLCSNGRVDGIKGNVDINIYYE